MRSDERNEREVPPAGGASAGVSAPASHRTSGSFTPPVFAGGLTEATVVSRAQDGDLGSFEMLLRHYQRPIFRLCFRMLADRAEAEDVVQDTFITVWRKLPNLTDPVAFQRWVYQIATRRCLTLLRMRARRRVHVSDADELSEADLRGLASEDPAAVAESGAQLQGLDRVLQELPDEQRACWVLKDLHALTYSEIAYAMNLPVSTVRGRIARARQNLAKGMTSWR